MRCGSRAQGYDVTAMDQSRAGLEKAQRLARERGVRIETVCADLASYVIEPGAWNGIVSIFGHVPAAVRQHVHASVLTGLAPGGVFLLEAYRPEQIGRGTGGPPDDERMVNLERLRSELGSLEWLLAREIDREVNEGHRHTGLACVVQLVARRRDDAGTGSIRVDESNTFNGTGGRTATGPARTAWVHFHSQRRQAAAQ